MDTFQEVVTVQEKETKAEDNVEVELAQGKIVECVWLTGDVQALKDKCDIIGDIRLQMCALRSCIWHDLVLLTEDGSRVLDDDFQEAPEKVRVVLRGPDCVATQDTWSDTLHSHLIFSDVHGLKAALSRMHSEVIDSLGCLRQLWFGTTGKCEQVQMMLDADIDVDIQSHYGRTLLHKACERGFVEMGLLLVRAGADVCNVKDAFGFTPLHDAAYAGSYALCEAIMNARAMVNATDSSDYAPLHYAALKNSGVGVVELLVARSAGIDMSIISGWSALHMALNQNNHEVAQWLIANSADPNFADTRGFSVLHLACKLGQISAVTTLLEHKASADCQTRNGETPLLYAVQRKDKQLIKILLQENVPVHKKSTICGMTPWDCAQKIHRPSIVDLLFEHLRAEDRTRAEDLLFERAEDRSRY